MKLRNLTFLFFLCLSLPLLSAQEVDVKALAEKDLFRGDVPSKELKAERGKVWEAVSLSLLVREVEAAAKASGLESFSLNISNNAINIIYRDIRFLPDSSELTPETEEKIYKLTEILKRFSDMDLLVQGHTAKLSPEDTDDGMELSEGRARSVAGLISKTGLFDSEQIEAVGRGFYDPVADNATQEGRALNRRVEISIVGSVGQDSDNSMVWWELLSNSMPPGYIAYLVKNENLESVKNRLEEVAIPDLLFADTSAGVGIIDNKIFYKEDGAPDSDSIERMQKIGNLLPLIQPDTEVRIGGYGSDLSIEEIEKRHFLTAYNLAAIAGFKPDNITYSAAPYILTKATAALKDYKVSTTDGTLIELKGDGPSFAATVPYSVDSLLIDLTTEDPLAKITGLSEDTVSLVPGNNEIFVTLESSAGEQKVSQSYRLTVVRQVPVVTEAETLKELIVTAADGEAFVLFPPFSSSITDYTVSVPYSVSSVSVSPIPTDANARIDKELSEVALSVGNNEITTVVTDQLGKNPGEYHLTIERSAPLLSDLKIESKRDKKEITLVPEFSPEIKDYRAEVPYEVTDIEVFPSLLSKDEAVGAATGIDKDYAEGLNTGSNRISVTLSDSSSGDDGTYTISVVRKEPVVTAAVTTLKELTVTAAEGEPLVLSPSFSSDITEYTISVPYSVSSVSLNASPTDANARIEKVLSEVPLSVGTNKIITVVADQLGKNPRGYTLTIERSAPLLSDLEIKLDGNRGETLIFMELISGTKSYSVAVPYETNKFQLQAALSEEDMAAGASIEMSPEVGGSLPVGTTSTTIRVAYAEGKTSDYTVNITRKEKEALTFDVFGISLIPGWNITPSASFYTAGFGFKLNGGMTVRIAEDSKVNDALRPLRIGLGAHVHGGTGNYLSILSGAGYLGLEYIFQTENLFPDQWYIPKDFIPRVEAGAGYYAIDYTTGTYIEGAAFYISPGLRTDFIFPALPNIGFGIDLSYTAYIGPATVTYFSLGASVSFE